MSLRRARRNQTNDAAPGQDSFLDIVSNIVGILIILVMVACARVQTFHDTDPDPQLEAVAARVESHRAAAATIHRDTLLAEEQAARLEHERALRSAERDHWARTLAAAEQEIERHKQRLTEEERRRFEQQRMAIEARNELDRLRQAAASIRPAPRETIVIETSATPISQTVQNEEVHFRLLGGRLAEVPMQLLVDWAKRDAQRNVQQLQNERQTSGMVGPIAGFRMLYTFIVVNHTQAALAKATFAAERTDLGQPVAEALQRDSDFMRTLAGRAPASTTVTIWLYPDSFNEFRRVRDEVQRLGYMVAARPLGPDDPIGASAFGSKSLGQ